MKIVTQPLLVMALSSVLVACGGGSSGGGNASSSAVSSFPSNPISSSAPAQSSSSLSSSSSSQVSSLISSSLSSQVASVSSQVSSVSSVSSSSSVATDAAWELDSSTSYLNFVTTKNTHNVEVHNFLTLTGEIGDDGVAVVRIDLDSVNTANSVRDGRMRDFLFETATYPTATITVVVPGTLLDSLATGQTTQASLSAEVDLHGVTTTVAVLASVQRLSDSRVLVQSTAPVLTRAADFNLTAGVESLRSIANLVSISSAVPVDFALVFDAR